MHQTWVAVLLLAAAVRFPVSAQSRNYADARIVWDPSTLVLLQPGGAYGRMVRLPDRGILCAFEWSGAIYSRRSRDEGRTWDAPVKAASFDFGTPANPELLVLADGTVLLSYNERPTDGLHPFTIRICFSADGGRTWSGYRTVYTAGTDSGTGCWEPAQIQLASGEIQLYFSNESPYPSTTEQQITLIRSFDNGATWTPPEIASFRPGHRDGMPVPVVLNDGSGTVLSIEDNGLAGTFKPAVVLPGSTTRWAALQSQLPDAVYAGAPYLRQFPSGETVLSVQSADGRSNSGNLDHSRMVVYIGDSSGHGFTNASEPFAVPPGSSGLWNSLFIKNPLTVTAISGTAINGVAGIWAIDGRLEYPGITGPPSVEGVSNLAGGPLGPVAPGELVAITGSGLVAADPQRPRPITVYFNGIASPLVYTSGDQITALVPDRLTGAADVAVDYGAGKTYPFPLGVAPTAPEIFTGADGSGQALLTNADSSFNSPSNPAQKGTYVSFWATGQGDVTVLDGYARPVNPIRVTVGEVDADVSFAGLIYMGVLQVNVRVPQDARSGDAVPLVLAIGNGVSRKTATIAVR